MPCRGGTRNGIIPFLLPKAQLWTSYTKCLKWLVIAMDSLTRRCSVIITWQYEAFRSLGRIYFACICMCFSSKEKFTSDLLSTIKLPKNAIAAF